MKIISEKTEQLLERKTILLEIDYPKTATPSNENVKKQVADLTKTSQDLVIIKHIYPIFGLEKAKIISYIYNNIAQLNKIEKINKKLKKEKVKKETKDAKEKGKEQASK